MMGSGVQVWRKGRREGRYIQPVHCKRDRKRGQGRWS